MSHTVIDCRRYPGDNYLGNRVVRTDQCVSDFGVKWFERRALAYAERYAPLTPTYHLRVEKVGWLRYSVKAYQNVLGQK